MIEFSKEESYEIASDWKTQIEQCEKDRKSWVSRCDKIVDRYRDERTADGVGSTDGTLPQGRTLNLYWANVQTLQPAIYSQRPQPIAERRFLDKDPVGRAASQILERALRYEMLTCGFHESLKQVRNDYLLVGQGVPWVRYFPKFGDAISPETKAVDELEDDADGGQVEEVREEEETEQTEAKISESLCVDYVNWRDFFVLGRPRIWSEVETIAKRVYMGRYDLVEKFGAKTGKAIPLDHSPNSTDDGQASQQGADKLGVKATIYEIWCKYEKRVYFIAKSYDYVIQAVDDPLKLDDFFPCPRPIFANATNDTIIPVPDYVQAQDQYQQINDLTRRIDVLTNACRVAGVYDASNKEVSRIFSEAKEPQLIPVENWATFSERGGTNGTIEFVPIEIIAKTLSMLIEVRKQIMEDLYEVTGISDIIRGATDPNETLGAQQLKQQNAVGRLQERQDEFARLCRDTICIMGEIIAEHYDDKTLIQVSGAMFDEGLAPPEAGEQDQSAMMGHNGGPPMNQPGLTVPGGMGPQPGQPSPQPLAQAPAAPMPMMPPLDPMQARAEFIGKAIQLLRDEKLRGFRIDIETDSTIQPDANQEKVARVEFLKAVTEFLMQGGQMAMQEPGIVPLLGKMLMFGVRGFRVGRDLESTIEEFTDKATERAKEAAANPQPNPEQMKAQAEIEKAKMMAESSIRTAEITNQGKEIDLRIKGMEMQMKQMEFEQLMHQGQQELMRSDQEMQMQERQQGMDIVMQQQDHDMQRESHEAKLAEGEAKSAAKPNGSGAKANNGMAGAARYVKGLQTVVEQLEKTADKIDRATALLTAEREVIRGPDGKVMGHRIKQPERAN